MSERDKSTGITALQSHLQDVFRLLHNHHITLGLSTGAPMSRLINAYRTLPSPSNRAKLEKYLKKHPFAVCLASDEEVAFLKAHAFN